MDTPVKTAIARCLSCERWGGERRLSGDRAGIVHAVEARGLCREGPWHGTLREPRNACGHWLVWAAIKTSKAA